MFRVSNGGRLNLPKGPVLSLGSRKLSENDVRMIIDETNWTQTLLFSVSHVEKSAKHIFGRGIQIYPL